MAAGRRPRNRVVDGFSEGAWKSLAVKSLRIGWPEGLRQAELRLGRSTLDAQLLCGMFEDVFPAVDELDEVRREIKDREYELLCARETHHGRGLSGAFCDLAEEAVAAAKVPGPLWAKARELNLWLPARALNTFYTWLTLRPTDAGVKRPTDTTAWQGMPTVSLDAHTPEGRQRRSGYGALSGDYDTHRLLGRTVTAEGWDRLRREAHQDVEPTVEQLKLQDEPGG